MGRGWLVCFNSFRWPGGFRSKWRLMGQNPVVVCTMSEREDKLRSLMAPTIDG